MGGTLAIDFTLLHPDRVAGIVVIGSGPDGYPIPKEDQDKMNAVFSIAAQKGLPIASSIVALVAIVALQRFSVVGSTLNIVITSRII